jgi:phage-related protein
LKDVGINYKATGDKGKDFTNIQAILSQQVGGFAENEGKTAAGQAQILGNQFGELKEAIGAKLLPVLMTLGTALLATVGWLQQNQSWLGPLAIAFASVGAAVWLGVKAYKAGTAAMALYRTVKQAVVFWTYGEQAAHLRSAVATVTHTAATVAHTVASKAVALATKAWAAAQWLINAAMTANPIGIVIAAIVALVAGIVYAYKHSEKFREIVQKVWAAIKVAFTVGVAVVKAVLKAGWDVLKRIFSYSPLGIITANFGKVIGFFKALPGKIGAVIGVVKDIIVAPFKAAFNAIARAWNATVGKISLHAPSWVPGIGGKGFDVPDIPTLAQGGVVRARPGGTVILAGEAGSDEAIVPLRRGVAGLGNTVVININGPVTDRVQAARWIRDALDAGRRAGVTIS